MFDECMVSSWSIDMITLPIEVEIDTGITVNKCEPLLEQWID